jgi:SAM-dependent methyltransferase
MTGKAMRHSFHSNTYADRLLIGVKTMETTKNIFRYTAEIYDMIHDNVPPMPDIPFYLEYARQVCGESGELGEILELGCGTGRVALALAKEGFRITGLDLSQQMLDVFNTKLIQESSTQTELADRVTIVHGNMADFSIGRKFALITAPFRAFQAVTDQKDIENTLSCVREHLAEEGLLIVNVFNPYADPLDESWCKPEEYIDEITDEKTGIRIARYECREGIDLANQVIYPYLAYVVTYPDGRTERLVEPLQMKYYYSRQLRAEVEKAGLAIIEEYSWYDKTPPGGREIILICKKGN